MIEFAVHHQFWIAAGLYWFFSAAVSAMPEPGENASAGYLWLYRFLHTTAGNLTTVFGNKLSGLKTILFLLAIPIVLTVSACAVHYTIHPGALNVTDSAAYDALLVAQAAIDEAKTRNQGKPDDTLNTVIRSYDVARESWFTYRGALATNVPSDAYSQQLNQNLADLFTAIRQLKEAK
jgi:hypothetical protein